MTTIKEKFLKSENTREQVEKVRQVRLTKPLVTSCEITEDATNWILSTVIRPVQPNGQGPPLTPN